MRELIEGIIGCFIVVGLIYFSAWLAELILE